MKHLKVTVNGTVYDVQVEEAAAPSAAAAPPAGTAPAPATAPVPAAASPAPAAAPAPKASAPAGGETIASPMPGTIVSVSVVPGQKVKKDDVLLVLEAMKMENEIMAPHDATVAAVLVSKGDSVNSGTSLVSFG